MSEESKIIKLKSILRETEMPMFSDEELQSYLKESDSFESAAYELLIRKSENTTIQIAGLTTADTSDYFRRLAATFRPFNTGVLGGSNE